MSDEVSVDGKIQKYTTYMNTNSTILGFYFSLFDLIKSEKNIKLV